MEQEIKFLRKKIVQLEDMILNMNETFGKVLDGLLNYRSKQVQEEQVICRTLFSHLKSNVVPIPSETRSNTSTSRPTSTALKTIRPPQQQNSSKVISATSDSPEELNAYNSPSASSSSSHHHFQGSRKQSTAAELYNEDEDESSNEVEFIHPVTVRQKQQLGKSTSSSARLQHQSYEYEPNVVFVSNPADYNRAVNSRVNNVRGLRVEYQDDEEEEDYFEEEEAEDEDGVIVKSEDENEMDEDDFTEVPLLITSDMDPPNPSQQRTFGQERSHSNPASRPRRRRATTTPKRSRTTLMYNQVELMESHFRKDPVPDSNAMSEIGVKAGLDKTVVKNWFKNRRARARRETGTL